MPYTSSGNIVQSLLSGLVDSSGNPLSAGKVYTYSTGTTTPKSLYTDKALTSAAANPLILSANGTAQVYANGAYKFVVKTSADATVATWDNIDIASDQWTDWTPTYTPNGAMTYSSVTTTFARYKIVGKELRFRIAVTGTVGGVPSNYIAFSLPATVVNEQPSASVVLTDNALTPVVGSITLASTTSYAFWRFDRASYTAGTVAAVIHGFAEVA